MPVNAPRRFAVLRSGTTIAIEIGDWPSGLYFAKLTSPGRVGFAPFVVRPAAARRAPRRGRPADPHLAGLQLPRRRRRRQRRHLVRDSAAHLQSRLGRPFLNRGVPPHFRKYDLRFLRWLHQTGRSVDVLSQAELDGTTGARLAAAYDLLVFPGHHEYVTAREYDAVEGFRDRGGNLIFLSANNFFWRIDLHGRTMTRVEEVARARPPRGRPARRPVHRQRHGRAPRPLAGRPVGRARAGSSTASSSGTATSSPTPGSRSTPSRRARRAARGCWR